MNNKLLTSAISAFDSVGFEVKLVAYDQEKGLDLFGVTHNGKMLNEIAIQGVATANENNAPIKSTLSQEFAKGYNFEEGDSGSMRRHGETWDIAGMMNTSDWREAIKSLQKMIRKGCEPLSNIGDFINISLEVPAAEHQGVKFKKLKIENAKIQIVAIMDGMIVFNFDEIIFKSGINARDTNDGGFADSALSRYLNKEFSEAMGISDLLISNHDDIKYSLLTASELFGDSEYWDEKTNWDNDDLGQMPYFKNEKNRVKAFENETWWHWTSSPTAHSASHFCRVSNSGISYSTSASSSGGVAPAFCVG